MTKIYTVGWLIIDPNKMAASGDTIHAVAGYLGVKCGKITYDGAIPVMKGKTGTRKGLSTITKHLARAAEKTALVGEKPEDKAVVDQWLEYTVCQVERCPSEKDTKTVFKDLNTYLEDKVYFLKNHLSLVDLVLYYTLHQQLAEMTFMEKQKYIHLSRWFSNIQQAKSIRQSFPEVSFSKSYLYTDTTH